MSKQKNAEYRSLPVAELTNTLKEVQKNLFDLRFQSATDRLETPSMIRKARRNIARLKTIIREQELKTQKK